MRDDDAPGDRRRFAFRLHCSVPIRFREATPIAGLGLAVNVAAAWLPSGAAHHHYHDHDHAHTAAEHDNNLPAATIHVMADAAVSALVIIGLILARIFGWLWMDSLAGVIGACIIASWCYGLIRQVRRAIEADGDHVADLHLWRLGPGHPAAIISVASHARPEPGDIRNRLAAIPSLSHVTVGVERTV